LVIDSPNNRNKKIHIIVWLALFVVILSGFRILWVKLSPAQHQASIHNGQLDLRNWDVEDRDILLLNGEWEFFPSQFLMDGDSGQVSGGYERSLIKLPGGWNKTLHPDKPSPYGFASYRLQIYVNPEKDLNYSIRIPSARSASEIYANGRLVAKSGQVGKTKEEYTATNLPYLTSFTADENGEIELVIQVANFIDSRSGGLVRSVKFGLEEGIVKEMKLSAAMQFFGAVMFLMHSIYAVMMYILGNKEKKLLYFSLMTLCFTLTNLLSNDEKLIRELLNLGYDWDFRLTNAAFIIGAYALLEYTDCRELRYWRRIYPVYKVVNLGIAGFTMLLAPNQVIMLFPVYFLLGGTAVVISLITVFQRVSKDINANLLLLFSILALIHHFLWSVFWREIGISGVHYPFELIISMGCLASLWFKDYFKAHADTKELADTLQRVNNHKDQFLANTSHEFKNPLHSILNMSQSVLNREGHLLQEKSIKELETVLTVGRRLTLMLNDLIDVMSLQEGNPRLQQKVIRIQPIVTAVIDMLQFNVDVKTVRIVNQVAEDFPAVIGDENRVVQIVFNLLHNAVKYTNEGEISVQAYVNNGRAYIVITDTGIGMDEDMLKRLFLPYEQVATDETMIEGGFGLGLSISKMLVELHGGTLDVSSVLGQGSKFMFSLQLSGLKDEVEKVTYVASNSFEPSTEYMIAQEEVSVGLHKAEAHVAKAKLSDELKRDRPQILVVDDDPVNLQVLETILSSDDYDTTMVTSGKEALAKLNAKEWDLVISDVMMPQMSGYELTRMIRERFTLTELPILLLTARSQPKDIQCGFLAGANDYVTKPVETIEIRSRIEALVTIKQNVQEQLRLEAAWLQAQIQPHFLFNALNSIAALSEVNLGKMQDLLDEFSHFMRNKFSFHNIEGLVPIEEELSLVRSYLYIEKVRFDERLEVIWEIDGSEGLKVPFLSIQPLVENAIRHGIMKRTRGGKLIIRISAHDTYTEISVEDDGIGIDEVQLQRIMERRADRCTGVGLINTDQRLKRHFGTGLHIESTLDSGTKVSFRVYDK